MLIRVINVNIIVNEYYVGDNLDIMQCIPDGYIDLVYIDPPFNSGLSRTTNEFSFKDSWNINIENNILFDDTILKFIQLISNNNSLYNYMIYMIYRILEIKRILKESGIFYIHIDPNTSHYFKVILDYIFQEGCFINEIIWLRNTTSKGGVRYNKNFIRNHDVILSYSLSSKEYTFNPQYTSLSLNSLKHYNKNDNDNKGVYRLVPVDQPLGRGNRYSFGMGEKMPKNGYRMSWETALKWLNAGELVITPNKVPARKKYLSESKGVPINSVWNDINNLQGSDKERMNYPTQKPLELLRRIILTSSNEGDLIFDPFCGSGTTLIAAKELGRNYIGCDISQDAQEIFYNRLHKYNDSKTS